VRSHLMSDVPLGALLSAVWTRASSWRS
jgi:hypothetical protein